MELPAATADMTTPTEATPPVEDRKLDSFSIVTSAGPSDEGAADPPEVEGADPCALGAEPSVASTSDEGAD